jgi:hypothetical protein
MIDDWWFLITLPTSVTIDSAISSKGMVEFLVNEFPVRLLATVARNPIIGAHVVGSCMS